MAAVAGVMEGIQEVEDAATVSPETLQSEVKSEAIIQLQEGEVQTCCKFV